MWRDRARSVQVVQQVGEVVAEGDLVAGLLGSEMLLGGLEVPEHTLDVAEARRALARCGERTFKFGDLLVQTGFELGQALADRRGLSAETSGDLKEQGALF